MARALRSWRRRGTKAARAAVHSWPSAEKHVRKAFGMSSARKALPHVLPNRTGDHSPPLPSDVCAPTTRKPSERVVVARSLARCVSRLPHAASGATVHVPTLMSTTCGRSIP